MLIVSLNIFFINFSILLMWSCLIHLFYSPPDPIQCYWKITHFPSLYRENYEKHWVYVNTWSFCPTCAIDDASILSRSCHEKQKNAICWKTRASKFWCHYHHITYVLWFNIEWGPGEWKLFIFPKGTACCVLKILTITLDGVRGK